MSTKSGLVGIVLSLFGLILFGSVLVSSAKIVIIDTIGGSISFKNMLFRNEIVFAFDELDGYVETIQRDGNSNEYSVIYLVKEAKYVAKVSDFFCSNYNELKQGLGGLKYLGIKKFNIIDSFKVLCGLSVYHK